jgi:hypothetical protein
LHLLKRFSDDEYFHLPNVRTVDGLLDLISGCTLAILSNVLDFRTYCAPNQAEQHPTTKEQQHLWKKYDRNNIPGDERMAMCHARGIALHLFRWIRMWCIVKTPDDEILDNLPSKHMVEILNALLSYKSKADLRKLQGAPHCGLWMLKAQILNVVKCDSSVEKLWNQRTGKPSDSLRMTLEEGTTVHWKDDAPRVTIHQSKLSFYLDLCETQYPQQISTSKPALPNSIAIFSMENSTDHNWRSRLFRRNHV